MIRLRAKRTTHRIMQPEAMKTLPRSKRSLRERKTLATRDWR